MDLEKIKHTDDFDDFLLLREIVDHLPWGVLVIDHDFAVQYMNQQFQKIFDPPAPQLLPMDGGKTPTCMGHILGCKYNGSADHLASKGACRHCELRISIDTLSGLASKKVHAPEDKYTVVKEFRINGENVLKYLEIQHVPLNGQRMMILVEDQTEAALAKLDAMENPSVQG